MEKERDYSNRKCSTCNLFISFYGELNNSCELKLESKCASFDNNETLKDYWISKLENESDLILYKK